MWGAIIQAIDHAAERINKGAGAGIEVAKSQSGGAAGNEELKNIKIHEDKIINSGNSGNNGNSGNSGTTDTTMFGKAVKTATNNIKDKLSSLNNNPKVEKDEVEEDENGTEKTEGTI